MNSILKKGVTFEQDDNKKKVEEINQKHNLLTQVSPNPEKDCEYSMEAGRVIALYIVLMNERAMKGSSQKKESHGQQYILQKRT